MHLPGANDVRRLAVPCLSSAQEVLIVKQKLAGGFAFLYRQCGDGLMVTVKLHHPCEIDGADHVNVMEQEGLCAVTLKEPRSFFQSAASIEQSLFARNFYL